jgi:hypothetical protein
METIVQTTTGPYYTLSGWPVGIEWLAPHSNELLKVISDPDESWNFNISHSWADIYYSNIVYGDFKKAIECADWLAN